MDTTPIWFLAVLTGLAWVTWVILLFTFYPKNTNHE